MTWNSSNDMSTVTYYDSIYNNMNTLTMTWNSSNDMSTITYYDMSTLTMT